MNTLAAGVGGGEEWTNEVGSTARAGPATVLCGAIDLALEVCALRDTLLFSSELREVTTWQDTQLDKSRKGGSLFVKSAKP